MPKLPETHEGPGIDLGLQKKGFKKDSCLALILWSSQNDISGIREVGAILLHSLSRWRPHVYFPTEFTKRFWRSYFLTSIFGQKQRLEMCTNHILCPLLEEMDVHGFHQIAETRPGHFKTANFWSIYIHVWKTFFPMIDILVPILLG